MTAKERLIIFIKHLGISQREFCRNCGLVETFVSSMRSSMPKEKAELIAQQYPALNIHWLLLNEGEMLKDGSEIKIADDPSIKYSSKSVPFWNLPVRAGRSLEEIIGKTKPDGYIVGLPGADMAENILPVVGTSMDPEVSDGALIGVRKMNNWETLNTERIYLIITHDERMIKRIEHDAENESILWCTSPNYAKFKIYKSDIIEIQRVCFVYNPK